MAARGELGAGDFSGNPDIGEIFREDAAQSGGQFSDGVVVRLGLPVQRDLFHYYKSIR